MMQKTVENVACDEKGMTGKMRLYLEHPPDLAPGVKVYAVTIIDGAPNFPSVRLPILTLEDGDEFPPDVTRKIILCAGLYEAGWAWLSIDDAWEDFIGQQLDDWHADGLYEFGQWCFLAMSAVKED